MGHTQWWYATYIGLLKVFYTFQVFIIIIVLNLIFDHWHTSVTVLCTFSIRRESSVTWHITTVTIFKHAKVEFPASRVGGNNPAWQANPWLGLLKGWHESKMSSCHLIYSIISEHLAKTGHCNKLLIYSFQLEMRVLESPSSIHTDLFFPRATPSSKSAAACNLCREEDVESKMLPTCLLNMCRHRNKGVLSPYEFANQHYVLKYQVPKEINLASWMVPCKTGIGNIHPIVVGLERPSFLFIGHAGWNWW